MEGRCSRPQRDAPRSVRCSTDVQGGSFEVQLKDIELARPCPGAMLQPSTFGRPGRDSRVLGQNR